MTFSRPAVGVDLVQTVLLGVSSIGLLASAALAFLALVDPTDFITPLWLWWMSLPLLIVALIVLSAVMRRRSKAVLALVMTTLAALPGFATLYLAAAVALQ